MNKTERSATLVPAVGAQVERGVGRLVPERCGIMHDRGEPFVTDADGCRLQDGHEGPHEFADQRGLLWLWETDMGCDCEHCMQCDGDYCTTYWRKTPNAEVSREPCKGESAAPAGCAETDRKEN